MTVSNGFSVHSLAIQQIHRCIDVTAQRFALKREDRQDPGSFGLRQLYSYGTNSRLHLDAMVKETLRMAQNGVENGGRISRGALRWDLVVISPSTVTNCGS